MCIHAKNSSIEPSAAQPLQRFSKQLTYCSAAPDVPDIQSPKDTEITWLSETSVLPQIAVVSRLCGLGQSSLPKVGRACLPIPHYTGQLKPSLPTCCKTNAD